MTKILLATAVVALVAFATPASAQAVKNCSILHPAAAMVAEEVITWKLPSQTDGSAYTGPGDVFVWTTPERARIGGTANRVGYCWDNGSGSEDRVAINYRLWFESGVAKLPLASGDDVWARTRIPGQAGAFDFESLIPKGAKAIELTNW